MTLRTTVVGAMVAMSGLPSTPVFAQTANGLREPPMVRIPPIMPPNATRSGPCEISYDVTPLGLIENVDVLRCTETLFSNSAARSVRNWRYQKSDEVRTDVTTKITYRILGRYGQILPAAPMPRRAENPEVPAFLQSRNKTLKDKRKQADNFCCFTHSVGVDGRIFNTKWETCPYSGDKRPTKERLGKMRFTPAFDKGEAVVSGGYRSLFWFHKGKAYTGTDDDLSYCAAQ